MNTGIAILFFLLWCGYTLLHFILCDMCLLLLTMCSILAYTMKKDIHPAMNPTIFRDEGAGVDIVSTSTIQTDVKETLDGVEYQVVPIEISAASHNFYTGEKRIVDTQGRVEKFRMRQEKAKGNQKKRSKCIKISLDLRIVMLFRFCLMSINAFTQPMKR